MNHSHFTVTVIIPTFLRTENLKHTLRCLENQERLPQQVIVVDTSPPEQRLHPTEYRFPLEYLFSPQPPNASRQRNEALRRVTTDWVLFLDDDVDFNAHLIQTYEKITSTQTVEGVSGLVKLHGREKYYAVKKHPARLYQTGGENHQGSNQIVETHVICTANFLAKTSAVLAAGGFDEQLSGTIDDVDLALRMKAQGAKIIHHPEAELLHLQERHSGARSFDPTWGLANLFYFQYRHFENYQKKGLLLNTLWHLCRPSRDWLHPDMVITRAKHILAANRIAAQKIQDGPKLLCTSPT